MFSLQNHLRPFTVAINAIQSDRARLDTVLVTLAKLYHIYMDPINFNNDTRQSVHEALEKCWQRPGDDCEVFILAAILNPFIRCKPFNTRNPVFTLGELSKMFEHVFKYFMGQSPNIVLKAAFDAYINNVGCWSDYSLQVNNRQQAAALEVCQ